MVTITYTTETEIENFPAWSGGKVTLDRIIEEKRIHAFSELAYNTFLGKIPTRTEINDWLWFDRDSIYEYLGIKD